jgi:4-amino-4-deoxy-L-arabinose transferase-like glycosyltransferase
MTEGIEERDGRAAPDAEQRVPGWLMVAVAVVVPVTAMLWNLGGQHVVTLDETQRLLPPVEMLETGDWVVPRTNGEVYLNKPPLIYWCIAASYKLAGATTPLAGRLPVALACLLTVGGVALVAARHGQPAIGVWSALILATANNYQQRSQEASIDPMLVLMVLGAAYCQWLAVRREGRRWLVASLIGGVWAGLAFLLKAHVTVPFLVAAAAAAWWIERPRWTRLLASFSVILGVGVVIALPWLVLVIQRLGWDFIWGKFQAEGLTRIGEAGRRGTAPFYYYLLHVPPGMLPWTWLLLFWLVRPFRNFIRPKSFNLYRFAGAFALIALVLYSFSDAKETRYVLPVFPFIALACGPVVEWALLSAKDSVAARWVVRVLAAWGVVLACAALAYLVWISGWMRWAGPSAMAAIMGIVCCAGAAALLLGRRKELGVLVLALGLVLGTVTVQDTRKSRANALKSVVPFLEQLDEYRSAGIPTYRFRADLQGLFYLRNVTERLADVVPDPGELSNPVRDRLRDIAVPGDLVPATFLSDKRPVAAVLTRQRYVDKLLSQLGADVEVVVRLQGPSRNYVLLLLHRPQPRGD